MRGRRAMKWGNGHSAFTLIELLVVVAIVAVLAAIATPNYLEAQTRAKMARVNGDLRAVTVALEAYRSDNNRYPSCAPDFDGTVGLQFVTTPIAYIASTNIQDVYAREAKTGTKESYGYCARDFEDFAYIGNHRQGQWFIITSNGPNLALDDYRTPVASDDYEGFVNTLYDPTNGVISDGNVYRTGGVFDGPGEDAARLVKNYYSQ